MKAPSDLLQAAEDAVKRSGQRAASSVSWTTSVHNDNTNAENQRSISIATHFLAQVLPDKRVFGSPWDVEDRLVKIGRNLCSITEWSQRSSVPSSNSEAALQILLDECNLLCEESPKYTPVPTIRFGRTDLQISMVTLGCMRLQQTWGQDILDMKQIHTSYQDTLLRLLKHAIIDLKINHIETARGYGSSEIQLGHALQQIFRETNIQRRDLIIQTKIGVMKPADFRTAFETSLKNLQSDYVDLLAIHGFNFDSQWDTVFGNEQMRDNKEESLMDIVREYQTLGKVRFIGFSTHGRADLISKIIQTDMFDYVNLHYHPFSSYTASGEGLFGAGNLQNILLANKHDMGVFIISPYDKGGKLYAPSIKLRQLTLPDMLEPIVYGTLWHWSHPSLYVQRYSPDPSLNLHSLPEIHTISCGAARSSDLDQIAFATHLWTHYHEPTVKRLANIQKRIYEEQVRILGKDWIERWFMGLPNCNSEDDAYQLAQIVSLYNMIQSLGLLEYARDRYATFDSNLSKWNFSLSTRDNIQSNVNKIGWGYMPGIATDANTDYETLLSKVPKENREKVIYALDFVRGLCSKNVSDPNIPSMDPDWETSWDMRPWCCYPDQKK